MGEAGSSPSCASFGSPPMIQCEPAKGRPRLILFRSRARRRRRVFPSLRRGPLFGLFCYPEAPDAQGLDGSSGQGLVFVGDGDCTEPALDDVCAPLAPCSAAARTLRLRFAQARGASHAASLLLEDGVGDCYAGGLHAQAGRPLSSQRSLTFFPLLRLSPLVSLRVPASFCWRGMAQSNRPFLTRGALFIPLFRLPLGE